MTSRSRFRLLLENAPGDARAIEFEGRWTTWGELRQVASTIQQSLRTLGLNGAARIGVVLEDRPEHVAALLAIIAGDQCVVTVSPLQPAERMRGDIAGSGVSALLASPSMLEVVGTLPAAPHLLELTLDGASVARQPVGRQRGAGDAVGAPGITVEMLTSGTTGPPKRISIADQQFDAALTTSVPAPPDGALFRSGTTLVTTPLVHIGGFWGSLGPLYAGRSIVLLGKFDLDRWVDAVVRHRPRAVAMVPATLRAVLSGDVPREKLASIEVATAGTAPVPVALTEEMLDRYGVRVLPTYGATEFAGGVTAWTLGQHREWWERKKGSVGRALPGVELRVVDDHGDEIPHGEHGILEIRGRQSPSGIHAWQPTSDLASLDEDGFLWIHGRTDDAIVRGGFKVHPNDVRAVLERHPAVREASVAPLPDARLGQVPVAAVEWEPGAGPRPTAEELFVLCRQHLTPYEVPARIVVLDELPRTSSMKVSRTELLDIVRSDAIGASEHARA
ncbi:long-chain fatty acid--CoA ligase [Nocardioides marmoriginsengisoli]|uniref:Long-chain fatty acid--CoA ligase n=1 Tax=Nocardioides marmoriginsengisoli TaxID=661483 RepID=A0A3N0CCW1_9ACTN|nr:fatty acid--CoA ligase family protein [Nocardioides marmoriginsengisoli]RNL61081.1 long-chain fatty acid--CoA ligase [Nocardioides marmoriginsengisoli]